LQFIISAVAVCNKYLAEAIRFFSKAAPYRKVHHLVFLMFTAVALAFSFAAPARAGLVFNITTPGNNASGNIETPGGAVVGTFSLNVSAGKPIGNFGGQAFTTAISNGLSWVGRPNGAWSMNATFSTNFTDPDFKYDIRLQGNDTRNNRYASRFSTYRATFTGAVGSAVVQANPTGQMTNIVIAGGIANFRQRGWSGADGAVCKIGTRLRNLCLNWIVRSGQMSNNGSMNLIANGGNAAEGFSFVISSIADLAVTKTNSAPRLSRGDSGVYTITLNHVGPATQSAAIGVVLNDQLPAGLTASGAATPSQGTYNAGTGDWDVGKILVGGTATLTIPYTIDVGVVIGSTITNSIAPAAITMVQDDPNTANNSASVGLIIDNEPRFWIRGC